MRIALSLPMTIEEISSVLGCACAESQKSTVITHLTTDSRTVEKGDLFLALRGERSDGNLYLPNAFASGAAAAICERACDDGVCLCVTDALLALGTLAQHYASKIPHKTVAVTGSIGKTTTKEFLRCVLSEKFRVHATSGNHNNEIGLPYTILSMPENTEILVLEMGMTGLGEIEYLSKIAKPDVGIVTTIGTSHLERLGTRENICRAKMEITAGMEKGALLLLQGDEPLLKAQMNHPLAPKSCSYTDGDYTLSALSTDESETRFCATLLRGVLTDCRIPMAGKHAAMAALFALAAAESFGMTEEEMKRGLLAYRTDALRQNKTFHSLKKDGKDIHFAIIRDCYNAAPESMRASLDVLKMTREKQGGRSLALLGDMKELGDNSPALHFAVGEYAAESGVSLLFTYGENADQIADGALLRGMDSQNVIKISDGDAERAAKALFDALEENDTLLFKASRAMQVERVADRLINQ